MLPFPRKSRPRRIHHKKEDRQGMTASAGPAAPPDPGPVMTAASQGRSCANIHPGIGDVSRGNPGPAGTDGSGRTAGHRARKVRPGSPQAMLRSDLPGRPEKGREKDPAPPGGCHAFQSFPPASFLSGAFCRVDGSTPMASTVGRAISLISS